MKNLFLLLFLLTISTFATAQEQSENPSSPADSTQSTDSNPTENKVAKSIVFIEFFGVGGYGSINYERLIPFVKQDFAIGFRIGFSTYHMKDFEDNFNPDIIIPLGINALYGKDHKFELGIGSTVSYIPYANPENGNLERKTESHGFGTIGYRYQKIEGGIFIRVVYSPIYENYETYRHWGGASIGFAF